MRLEPWRVRTRRIADAPTSAAQELGGELFAAFFHDELRDVLVASRSRCPDGLRIRIDLSEAPALTGIPWELLYDRLGNRHLALSERTPVVRYLQLAGTVAPLVVNGPLRILAVLASPSGLQPLDVEPEWEGMSAELAPQVDAGLVALDRLERPTTGDLHRYLRTHEVHVLHFVGHGSFDTAIQDGVLCLEDRRGQAQAITSGKLGPDLYDHDSLRLVVLNACETASSASTDTFSGMAQGLVQQGVPAVVAMQVPITDEAAVCFSRDFYSDRRRTTSRPSSYRGPQGSSQRIRVRMGDPGALPEDTGRRPLRHRTEDSNHIAAPGPATRTAIDADATKGGGTSGG